MKRFLFLGLLLAAAPLLRAQFELGIKGGANLQELEVRDFDGEKSFHDVTSGERKLGYHAGIYGNIKLSAFYLQPEVNFTQINNSYRHTTAGWIPKSLKVNFHRLDVPILAGLKLGPLRLNAGPVISFKLEENKKELDVDLKNGSWGYQAGLGLNMGKLRIDARYEGPFSQSADAVSIGNKTYQLDARTSQFILSVGLKLF